MCKPAPPASPKMLSLLSANTHRMPSLKQRQPKLSISSGQSSPLGGLTVQATQSTKPLVCHSKGMEQVHEQCCCASCGLSLPRACGGGRSSSEGAWLQTAAVPQTCWVLPRVLDNEGAGVVPAVGLSKVTDNQLTLTSADSVCSDFQRLIPTAIFPTLPP